MFLHNVTSFMHSFIKFMVSNVQMINCPVLLLLFVLISLSLRYETVELGYKEYGVKGVRKDRS
jgi:hypothetical protein